MDELPDLLDDGYDPAAVRRRVDHLPRDAQRDIEQISRILRAAFGYGEKEIAADGRIVSIRLTGACAYRAMHSCTIAGFDFHITVNLPECADEAHWHFARRLIASEIGARRPVTLTVDVSADLTGITLYDAKTDLPINARELSFRP